MGARWSFILNFPRWSLWALELYSGELALYWVKWWSTSHRDMGLGTPSNSAFVGLVKPIRGLELLLWVCLRGWIFFTHLTVSAHNKKPQRMAYKQQKFISHRSGGWMTKINMPAWSHSVRAVSSWCIADTFSLCPHVAEGVRELAGSLW